MTDAGESGGVDRDAHERRLEQYEALVESAGDPMFVLDDDGTVELCNRALAELFERPKSSLPGTPLSALLPRADATRIRETAAQLDADEWMTCDLRVGDPGEGERLFEVTVGTLQGDTAGTVATLHDVTERERREEELDLLKQVLTRVLRHDVRSGLTVIRGQAEVIRERADDDTAEFAQTIIDRSESLVETTEKARAIEGVLESDEGRTTVDLRSVVNRAVANVAAAHPDAEYDVRLTGRLPVVVHHALPYAIEDLVENAVVHNDSDRPQVTVSATTDETWVRLAVQDNGPGIPDEEIEVLERGEETPLKHGTGVGLWLVNWVVDRSGGDLSFENGGSTTATLRLERADAAGDR